MCLELGLTGQLFDVPLLLQDLVPDTWMKQTWIATHKENVHLMIDILDFQLNQHGDTKVTCIFLQHGLCQPQLEAIHQCCMFLKVLHLSNICNGSGDKIITRNWQNYCPLDSEFKWPKTTKPSAADWKTWHMVITTTWFYNPEEQAIWHNQKQTLAPTQPHPGQILYTCIP